MTNSCYPAAHWSQKSGLWTQLHEVSLSGFSSLPPLKSRGGEARKGLCGSCGALAPPTARQMPTLPRHAGRHSGTPQHLSGHRQAAAVSGHPPRVFETGTFNPRDFSAAAAGSMNWRTALSGHFQFRTERGGAGVESVSYLPRWGRGWRLWVRIPHQEGGGGARGQVDGHRDRWVGGHWCLSKMQSVTAVWGQ